MPTLNVAGWFDQEDFYGPLKIYELLEKHDTKNQNFLVVGPWNHGGWATGRATSSGKISFDSATGKYFREKVQAPWFAYHLKDKGKLQQPEALMFQTGTNHWVTHEQVAAAERSRPTKLYFHPDGKLSFEPPPAEPVANFDAYVSDPAHPVPYRPRPVTADLSRTGMAGMDGRGPALRAPAARCSDVGRRSRCRRTSRWPATSPPTSSPPPPAPTATGSCV